MISGDEFYPDDVTSGMFDPRLDPDILRDEIKDQGPRDHAPDATYATEGVDRPDLTKRTALSKSLLGSFDLCQTKTWYGLHDPRPFITSEKVVFGSAVDAGVEVLIKTISSGQQPDLPRAFAAAAWIVKREPVEMVFSEVEDAIESFLYDVVPRIDFRGAVTQASVTATIPGLGECNGHPDIIMDDGSVLDVKTSGRAKTVPSLELGFYALLLEATGATVPTVGYVNYVRLKKPYWHGYTRKGGETMGAPLIVPVTDDLRTWTREKAWAYVRAAKADEIMQVEGLPAQNYSMTGGPRFDGLCGDCAYNPALGGPCAIAVRGASDE
jgi:hypothetical protein